MERFERVKSEVDPNGSIDIDTLMEATARLGPLLMSSKSSPYQVEVGVYKCVCLSENCKERVVVVWRHHGLLSRHWLLSEEELLSFENLENFRRAVTFGAMYSPRGESLIIEDSIIQEFGKNYHAITDPVCACGACAEEVGLEVLSRKSLLTEMAFDLQQRDQLLEYANNQGGEDFVLLALRAFEAGFSLGRNAGDFFVKRSIEKSALKGHAVSEAARRGGQARSAIAEAGRTEILEEMRRLVAAGKSVSSAASIAAQKGLGVSKEANRQIWKRYNSGT